MKKLIVLFFVSIACLQSMAQSNVEFTKDNFKDKKDALKDALEEIKLGDELYEMGPFLYRSALPHYLKANDFNPNNALLNYKIGTCYVFVKTVIKSKAVPYIEKAYKLNPTVSPDIHYLLGRGYHLTMQWDKAKQEYTMYRQTLSSKDIDKMKDVDKKLNECGYGINYMKNPIRVFIDNVGTTINSRFSDYTPVISADEDVMMFTSRRDNSTGAKLDQEGEYFEDIYISYKFNKEWTQAKNIGAPINTNGHDAIIGLSPSGQKLFMYIDDKGDGNIYECDLLGDKWSKPEKMPKPINSSSHESAATISFDGKTIYWVSDREGGLGGKDIYTCTKNEKGKWGEAVNMGAGINTPYNEEGVFMLPDGKTLYFSSEGHTSMGALDIFSSVYENGKWSTPQNIGYPVNTPDNDMFFVMSASGKHGYYSSIREDGQGEVDLYQISFLGVEKQMVLNTEDNLLANQTAPVSETNIAAQVEVKTSQLTLLKGIITDALTKNPLEALIEIVDNEKNVVIASFSSNSKTGKYLVTLPSGKNYGIAVKKEGYLFHSENFDIPLGSGYQEITKDVELKNIAVGSKIVLKNIFFDFDKATLRKESFNELENLTKLLNDVPSLKIEISGHTDGKGSAAYNLTLSDNRAKAVVDYLVGKGIAKDRLVAKGYGLTRPIATNDTEEGRQLNRRTEFEILSK